MQYYEQDDRKSRRWGVIAVTTYLMLCAGLMFVTYRITLPARPQGILVELISAEPAGGGGGGGRAQGRKDIRPASPPARTSTAERIITTENPAAPEVVPVQPEVTPNKTEDPVPERTVNQRALFPGQSSGSAATASPDVAGGSGGGSGTGSGTGAGSGTGMGSGSGTGSGSGSGAGSGVGSGSGFSLSGRYLVGQLPRPAYNANAEGRVVIRITVDRDGKVTNAVYEQEGSTTNHGELVSAARSAALRARFTVSEADIQTGTITYNFRQLGRE